MRQTLNCSASFHLWMSLAWFLGHWPGQTLSHIFQRQVESADLVPGIKNTRVGGEKPHRGGMMEIPHAKPDGVLSSVGADDKQFLGSPSTENTTHYKGKGVALPDSRMWEQGNYTAPGICKLSIQADKVEKLEES